MFAPKLAQSAGNLDEAEQAARELLVRFPEVHDSKNLPFPPVTDPAAPPLRTERHIPNSIARGQPPEPARVPSYRVVRANIV